jgi:hypothetical protein
MLLSRPTIGTPVDLQLAVRALNNSVTSIIAAETEGTRPLMPNFAIGHVPKPFPSSSHPHNLVSYLRLCLQSGRFAGGWATRNRYLLHVFFILLVDTYPALLNLPVKHMQACNSLIVYLNGSQLTSEVHVFTGAHVPVYVPSD